MWCENVVGRVYGWFYRKQVVLSTHVVAQHRVDDCRVFDGVSDVDCIIIDWCVGIEEAVVGCCFGSCVCGVFGCLVV